MAVGEGKVLFSRNVKPGMFGLGMVLKESFLTYSTQFIFLTIWLEPVNVYMVAIYVQKKPHHGGVDIWNYVNMYFNISVVFIVDNTFILKLVFLFPYCFHLDSHLSGCVTVIIAVLLLLLFLFFGYCNLSFCHGHHHYWYFCYVCHILL